MIRHGLADPCDIGGEFLRWELATAVAGAIVALVGVVNVPIIYFSVKWWNTLHQGASVSLTKAPSMATTMLWGMLLMALAFWMYSIAMSLYRVRAIILEREHHAGWVAELPEMQR